MLKSQIICHTVLIPIKATVRINNGNIVHAQVIMIISCYFTNFSDIYLVGEVHYFPGSRFNTISSGALNFHVGFQKVTSEHLEYCDYVDTEVCSCILPYQTKIYIDYLYIDIFKGNPQRKRNIVVPLTFFPLTIFLLAESPLPFHHWNSIS